uniref:uncharacterized protein LOC120340188 n=1 Tax=Styela clava TaxID=7725 RepID=UPI00193A123D|nr:uncharacterized protein LOC120340188 [Styela clava]
MLFNNDVCDLDEVKDKLYKSSMFGWSWSRERREPYRHTAIVLRFNKIPCFTINFRPRKGSGKFEAAFSECGSAITIERINNPLNNNVEYFAPFKEFEIQSEHLKTQAFGIIKLILSYDPGKYNLVTNNCRHHVDGVKKYVASHVEELKDNDYNNAMVSTKNGDVNRFMGAAFTAFAAVGGVVVAAAAITSAIFGSKEEEDEENQKVKA